MAIRRHRMLALTSRYPAVYVFDGVPPPLTIHPRSVVLPRMPNSDLARLNARSRGDLCFNPTGKAGACSDRLCQAVDRVTIPPLHENPVIAHMFPDGGGPPAGPPRAAQAA